MRLDYLHTGRTGEETFRRDRVVLEPLPWPGNPESSLDKSNLGVYFFEVRDRQNGRILYSQGYSSIFAEWQTTEEAKRSSRTFSESLRFPAPANPVRVSVKKRDSENRFQELWATDVDPQDRSLEQTKTRTPVPVTLIQVNGPPPDKADLLFLGEGYTAAESDKCQGDVRRTAESLFQYSPFRERRTDFNLRAICAPATESGVSHPSRGVHRRTLFGSKFDAFGTERYALSFDNRAIRDLAEYAPYEFLVIVMNDKAFGGGGIFGQFASVSIDGRDAMPAFIHEFGHHFTALADEYFLGPVAYSPTVPTVEPWEPNITAALDPKNLKWKDLITVGTPIPTPWPKAAYVESKGNDRYLISGPYAGAIGAFEGANYVAKGYYRSEQSCLMMTLTRKHFCGACRRAIDQAISRYAQRGSGNLH